MNNIYEYKVHAFKDYHSSDYNCAFLTGFTKRSFMPDSVHAALVFASLSEFHC